MIEDDKVKLKELIGKNKLLPVSKIISNDNRYSHWCDYHEQWRFYSVCVFKIKQVKKGVLKVTDNELTNDVTSCVKAIAANQCPALAMLNQEATQKHAIYYKDISEYDKYKQGVTSNESTMRASGSYLNGWQKMSKVPPTRSTTGGSKPAEKQQEKKSAPAQETMADLVNIAMEENNE